MRAPLEVRLLAKIEIDAGTGCWNWTASRFVKTGYGQISLGRKNMYVHRVSYELHIGPIPSGLHVCHRCDNRVCANPDHLFLGTPADNMADRNAKGRQASGSDITKNRRPMRGVGNGRAKLSEADVLAIRNAVGSFPRELAARYGISRTQTRRIINGESWPVNRVPETQTEMNANDGAQQPT